MKPRQLEKSEQAGGVKLLMLLGAKVYVLGTRRSRGKPCPKCGTFVDEHQGTRQTPGIGDVLAFLPARDGVREPLWWEAKRPINGRLSSAQREFRDLCLAARAAHCVGSCDDLINWLIENRYLRDSQVPHYRVRQVPA